MTWVSCYIFIESTDWGRTKSIPKFGVLKSVQIRIGQGSKNKTVFKLCVESTLVIWVRVGLVRNEFPPLSTVWYICIVFIASGKFPKSMEAFHHPTLMGNCLTLVTSTCPIYPYLVDEFHFSFLLFLTTPPHLWWKSFLQIIQNEVLKICEKWYLLM